ncbi:MAG: amylo-alpha-1,6-glucosidase [Bacteroidales bacterium]|nr:amylo-alpha-1,6-glucosidase [Bacteroidales bacterium]MCF8390883.1 amylo-alpha-1,6-glucosidase [Bacteroidales bacterium]
MGYLKFDKKQLVNLEYSLSKEIIRTNRSGAFATSTIIGCNTRKYHGLLICPANDGTDTKNVLLSTLDVTVIQHDQEFNLGIHKYSGDLYVPKGHKYVRDYMAEIVGEMIYRVGGVVLKRESILLEKEERILIKFTLLEAHSPTYLRFKPFLAFRNMHHLSKANLFADTKYRKCENGIVTKMYKELPSLYMQFSSKAEYVHSPDWYYNIEYMEEQKRGYDYKEDLFVPGYFETKIKKGESIIFSAGTKEADVKTLKRSYTSEFNKRTPRDSFENCLRNSAEQFMVKNSSGTEIIAGYPWFGAWGRDTFISLPGITLSTGNIATAKDVIDKMVRRMKGGLFPNMGDEKNPAFNSVDAPMWFIWSLQQFEKYDSIDIWASYGKVIKTVLTAYREGASFNIRMLENGLIWAGEDGKALTWMDAVTSSGPVTQRKGMNVEINALWYNAIVYSLNLAQKADDKKFIKEWKDLPELIKASFIEKFWRQDKAYLADTVDGDLYDFAVRPNMVIATAMEHSMLTKEMKNSILEVVKSELLTPKGLRTLAPKNVNYKGVYEGNQDERDSAYHQGTAWPWLLEHFVKAYMDVHKNTGLGFAKKIYNGFEEDMMQHGIGSISEIYDGDPPHAPKGSISQAWSVSALLRINEMIEAAEKRLAENQ